MYRTHISHVLATGLSSPYCHITPTLNDAQLARVLALSKLNMVLMGFLLGSPPHTKAIEFTVQAPDKYSSLMI
jgi:hypothetical protein